MIELPNDNIQYCKHCGFELITNPCECISWKSEYIERERFDNGDIEIEY